MARTNAGRAAIRIFRAIEANVQRWYDDAIDHPTFTARQGRLWRAAERIRVVYEVTDLCRAWQCSAHHGHT
jgi:hypothetical protein